MKRRGFFSRAVGAVGVLLGVKPATSAPTIAKPLSYTVVAVLNIGGVVRIPAVVKDRLGMSELRPSHLSDGTPCMVSDLMMICDDVNGYRHTINMRDVEMWLRE